MKPIDTQFMLVKSADHSQLADLISQAESTLSGRLYSGQLQCDAAGAGGGDRRK